MTKDMNFRILACTALASAALVSCQEMLIEKRADGMLALSVENSPVIEAVTRAGEEVDTDLFTVYITSSDGTFSQSNTYAYYQQQGTVTVPAGRYTVSAENVTDAVAHPADGWGQARYYGASEEKAVTAGPDPTPFEVECRMVNTAVSVVFDASVAELFEVYDVEAYTVEIRKLTYDASSASSVGYFPSDVLYYKFTAKYAESDTETKSFTGHCDIDPATHMHLTFKIKEQPPVDTDGDMSIMIDVISDCEDLYSDITFDPSDGSVTVETVNGGAGSGTK